MTSLLPCGLCERRLRAASNSFSLIFLCPNRAKSSQNVKSRMGDTSDTVFRRIVGYKRNCGNTSLS